MSVRPSLLGLALALAVASAASAENEAPTRYVLAVEGVTAETSAAMAKRLGGLAGVVTASALPGGKRVSIDVAAGKGVSLAKLEAALKPDAALAQDGKLVGALEVHVSAGVVDQVRAVEAALKKLKVEVYRSKSDSMWVTAWFWAGEKADVSLRSLRKVLETESRFTLESVELRGATGFDESYRPN